jgi:tetratricopeptide (TPR) repeat protein
MMQNAVAACIDDFVFNAVGYRKPPVLALAPDQSKVGLKEFYKKNSPTTARIRNNTQLDEAKERIDKAIKYVKPVKKIARYASSLLEAMTVSPDGLSMSLTGILNMQPPSAASTDLPSVFIVEEDSIEPTKFAEFVSRFQQIGDEKKPRIVLVANNKLDDALNLISTCGDNVLAHVLSSSGLTEVSTTGLACTDFGEYINFFLSEGDGYCSSTEVSDMFSTNEAGTEFNRCIVSMLEIQSCFRCGQKFQAADKILMLANSLEHLREQATSDALLNKALCLKAICNLWVSYITEAHPENIRNSLSIAEHLGDDLLLAHALKLIPIDTDRSSLTHQMLEKAKGIFEATGEIEQALFVENNILENNLYSERIDVERAVNLSQYVTEITPYIRRSTTFHSNAAIALMLCGKMTEAREVFDLAIKGSGPSVNLLNSEVNALITGHLDGETIDEDRIIKVINKITRSKIDPNFDYHQAIMFGNLWKICEYNKDLSGHIVNILKDKSFLDYGSFLDDPDSFVKFATTRSYDLGATKPARQPGVAGAFIEEHGLMPASHVFYR